MHRHRFGPWFETRRCAALLTMRVSDILRMRDQLAPRAGNPLVHVRHERHAEQRRREIEDRDRYECRDEGAGEHDGAVMAAAELKALGEKVEAN